MKRAEEDKGGVKINRDGGHRGATVEPGKRLWLTADGKRLVPDGHKEAATLYCPGPGKRVPRAEFERLSRPKGPPNEQVSKGGRTREKEAGD